MRMSASQRKDSNKTEITFKSFWLSIKLASLAYKPFE